ncbi:hypothetical protein [Embleya scabrispora]|uniref:hypothetical protein n=1 Tax=Embleya scabrispora TaxID=159449 RepID=UPI0003A6DEB8|nr:hypothetical protein [Embleya scabrispora]MYS80711.1 hypothetical protein [Streptomyces sp. SID5474]
MRRTITSISVWLAVTAMAVALSWWGVRSVLRDTVFEPPRPPTPIAGEEPPPTMTSPPPTPDASSAGEAPDLISAINRTLPPTSASATPSASSAAPSPKSASVPAVPPAQLREEPPAPAVQSFEVRGGRASFRYQATSATLIAATPNPGWAVKVWPGDKWIRVDFVNNRRTSSVFVVWNGHQPIASTYEG